MKKTAILAAMSLANLAQAHSLDFAADKYTAKTAEVNGATIAYRAYEGIPYVNKPVEPEYQQINIYIPEAYYEGGSINGYTAKTAPIFLPNQIGGYMPAKPGVPGERRHGGQPGADAMQTALAKGYIVASPGARGRTSPTGKAPAAIYDLKAAVRYLRHNDAAMPGDAEKIISNGTSAGGALSILLGASITDGDDRKLFVEIMGAADARDDIYAVSAYCPISILEHADAAYEWEFNGVHDYEKMDITMLDYKVERKLVKGTLDAAEQRVSDELKAQFPAYVNSLGLKNAQGEPLALNADGSGSFRDYVAAFVAAAANKKALTPPRCKPKTRGSPSTATTSKTWTSPPTPKRWGGKKPRPPSTRLTSPAAKTSSLATNTRTRATSPPTARQTARSKARAAPAGWR